MSSNRRQAFRWVFYCGYAAVLLAVLAYFRFPGEQFRQYCERQAESWFTGLRCSIGGMRYVFPFGLRLSAVSLTPGGGDASGEAVLVPVMEIAWSPEAPGRQYRLRGEAYSGSFQATLTKGDKAGAFALEGVEIKGLDISKAGGLQKQLDRSLRGRLDYSGRFSGEVKKYAAGSLKGKILLSEGSISLHKQQLELEAIDLQHLEADIEYAGNTLQVKNGRMRGKEVSAEFSSEITVVEPWFLSTIDMTGDLAVHPDYLRTHSAASGQVEALRRISKKQTMHFRVSGGLQSPSITWGY